MPVFIPLNQISEVFEGIKRTAKAAGRDPGALSLLVRANVEFRDAPATGERADFTGTPEEIQRDIQTARSIGASDLLFDVQFSPDVRSVEQMIDRMIQLKELAG